MNNTKGQATLVVVVASILVFVFVLILRILSSVHQQLSKPHANDIEVLQNYIKSCVDRKIHRAILLLGKQGGRIFETQRGKTSFPPSKPYIYHNGFYVVLDLNTPSHDFFFALNHFAPYVCGEESPSKQNPFEEHSFNLKDGCKLGDAYIDKRAIPVYFAEDELVEFDFKYDLFHYLNNTLDKCYNFSRAPFDFKATPASDWDLNVHVTDDNIVTDVRREVVLEFKDGRKEKITTAFRNIAYVRLKKLVQFIYKVVVNETTNLSFNPEEWEEDGFWVIIERNVTNETTRGETEETHDDILRFVDNKSSVDGDPFEIWIGRENYYPIISFLPAEVHCDGDSCHANPEEMPVYINISPIFSSIFSEGDDSDSDVTAEEDEALSKYLPYIEPYFKAFLGNCTAAALCACNMTPIVEGKGEEYYCSSPIGRQCKLDDFKAFSDNATTNLINYLTQNKLVSFYDRDEDNLLYDWKTSLNCNYSAFPGQFNVTFNVTDGEYVENSTVYFEFIV